MKRLVWFGLCATLLMPLPAFAGGLESFLGRVNVEARADLPGFSARVSTQFGVPLPKVEAVLKAVPAPADAFMVFQLGEMAHTSPERVLGVYQTTGKRGWGAMAQELGIKPGSSDFKRLKNGELNLRGGSGGTSSDGERSKGKGGKGSKGGGH